MQTIVMPILTILSVFCCESSLLASASKLSERSKKPYAHWTRRTRNYQSDRQKADDRKKLLEQASLDKQPIEKVKKGNADHVSRLLGRGANANAQCANGVPAVTGSSIILSVVEMCM